MSTIISRGSEPFPELPRVSLELPDGWEAMPIPEALIAAGRVSWEGFRSNVTVTVDRVLGPVELAEVGENTWKRFASSPEFEGLGHKITPGFGQDAVRMEGAFQMADVGPLFQVCLLTIVAHEVFTDVVYAVGTTGRQGLSEIGEELRAIIHSVTLQ